MIVTAVTKSGMGTWDLGHEDSGTPGHGTRGCGTQGRGDWGTGDAALENAGTRRRGAYGPQGSDKQTTPDFFAEFVMYNSWCSHVRFYMLESLSAD